MRFSWLKAIGGPGSLGFFLLVAAIALLLVAVSRRTRRAGRRLLLVLGVTYFFLSLPVVATLIAGDAPPIDISQGAAPGPIGDVFVFDGDSYESRAAVTASLDRSGTVRTVWILGFDELRDALLAAGVTDAHLRWGYIDEPTTYGQVVRMKELMERHKIPRAAAVVSRIQASRVAGLIRRAGLNATVVAAPMNREPAAAGAWILVPSRAAIELSRDGLYERVARIYYRWQGWN